MNTFKKLISVFMCAFILAVSFLTEFSYAAGAVFYDMEDGILYVSGKGAMEASYKNNTEITEVHIERGITSVPDEAFSGCTNLEKATISNSVLTMGSAAFFGCSALEEVKLSNNTEKIEDNTFSGCSSLMGIKIPDNTWIVGKKAFSGCSSLKYAIITNSVDLINDSAFNDCTSLEKIYYAGGRDEWDDVYVRGTFPEDKLEFLAPVFSYTKTYSGSQVTVHMILSAGSVNALDMVFTPVSSASASRIQCNNRFTSTSNRTTGVVSMAAVQSVAEGSELLKIVYNISDCENYSVDVSFGSCSAAVEDYVVNINPEYLGTVIQGGHSAGNWTVTEMPGLNTDGEAEAVCACCGEKSVKEIPFAFKNCGLESGNIICVSDYGMMPAAFAQKYFLFENIELNNSFGIFTGTGSAASVDYSDGISLDYTVSLNGDVDGDGFCDGMDSVLISCISENMLNGASKCALLASDCSKDGITDYIDAEYAAESGINLIK